MAPPADPLVVLSTLPISAAAQAAIRAVDPGIDLLVFSADARRRFRGEPLPADRAALADDELAQALARAEVWFTFSSESDRLPRTGPLRWVQLAGAGADVLLRGDLPEGVLLTNSRGLAATPIAEWVLAFLLLHAKRLPFFLDRQREGVWQRADTVTLRGATVAIVGLGAIGAETARLCQAFGARVLASRRSARPGDQADHCEALYGPAHLRQMIARADYVVLAVPLTPETRGFFGAAEFRAMQPTAVLVNIARGAVVDWPAMLEALRGGGIAAVYTDVTVPEPLPPDDPAWSAPNLFITPHNSGLFPDYLDRATDMFVENLRRYRAEQPLLRLVDRRLGY